MDKFLNENYWDSPTLTLLNAGNVLNMLNALIVLYMPNTPKDPSLVITSALAYSSA